MPVDLKPFEDFIASLEQATNETQTREIFIALASTGFGAEGFAAQLALSAEYQVRFETAGVVRRGVVDAFFGNLVIEFERDLKRTGAHALEQLQSYVAGAWREDGNTERPYLAIASDGAFWEVYAPTLTDPAGAIDALNISLELSERYPAPGEAIQPDSLRDFLNRLFFRHTLLKPTAANFARDFGLTSPAFLATHADLLTKLDELNNHPRLQVMQRAWSASLQISYGSVETDIQLFAKHTYLAVLARLLVWASLERRALRLGEVAEVLDGRYFIGRKISNLVEDDYFRWYEIPSPTDAHRQWVALSRHLAGYDLGEVREDILKPLYEQLVDPAFRHDLGEYYTPDWLAERVVHRVLPKRQLSGAPPRVLDPTCGSGTFLRAAIAHYRRSTDLIGSELAEAIISSVAGIDVHPLAVIIARATYLLAIKDIAGDFARPINLPVYLANSLQFPEIEPTETLFGERIPLTVEGKKFPVPLEFVQTSTEFDEALDDILAVARSYGKGSGQLGAVPGSVRARLRGRLDHFRDSRELVDTLGQLAMRVAELIRADLDSVHGFMLKNHYRPAILRGQFDYIVGNPPWLTVADVREPQYKALIIRLNVFYGTAPRGAGEQAHTELATVFLPHVISHFLEKRKSSSAPRLGFVMPRSVFAASHHTRLRTGRYRAAMNVEEVWDLSGVTPLFNVPACVVFASTRVATTGEKPLLSISGRLPERDLPDRSAGPHLTVQQGSLELAFLGKRSAWREKLSGVPTMSHASAAGVYAKRFRQGAILYPQTLFVVTAEGTVRRQSGPVRVRTDERAAASAKILRDKRVRHLVDGENLYLTAAAEHVFPYALSPDLWTVILPTVDDPGSIDFGPVSPDELRDAGRVDTAGWLEWADRHWSRVRKKGSHVPLWERVDHLGQLSSQSTQQSFLVVYAASGSRVFASVVEVAKLKLPFVVRDKTYWWTSDSREEAHYLAGFLNSDWASQRIVDWMTTGLFGGRDIHKRVLDLHLPAFDRAETTHRALALTADRLGSEAMLQVPSVLGKSVGRARVALRALLNPAALGKVEFLVGSICESR